MQQIVLAKEVLHIIGDVAKVHGIAIGAVPMVGKIEQESITTGGVGPFLGMLQPILRGAQIPMTNHQWGFGAATNFVASHDLVG